ncbi:MAG: hypothetical protein IJ806_09825 [Ruminococcus sp.]|nr:hypothetical protein [Ruminococcus sp.]
MYCENCGTKLRGGSLYCDRCGTRVDVEDTRIPLLDLVDFGIDESDEEGRISIPENADPKERKGSGPDRGVSQTAAAGITRRWNFLPMFFSVVSLICVMALCVSVLAYAITYDMRTKRINKTISLEAEEGSGGYTQPPVTMIPAQGAGGDKAESADKDIGSTAEKKTTTKQRTTSQTETSTTSGTQSETAADTTTKATSSAEKDLWEWLIDPGNVEDEVTTTTTATSRRYSWEEPEEEKDDTEEEVRYDVLQVPESTSLMDIMYVSSKTGDLYLRKGPGYAYGYVNNVGIKVSEQAEIYAQQFDDDYEELWLYVESGGYKGWAPMSSMTHVKPATEYNNSYVLFTAKTSKSGTYAYSGAGKSYDKTFYIPAGERVEVYDFSEDLKWLYVYYNYGWGWIKEDAVGF